jgi:acyl-CoA synthetase (AMP-forming)/AMP-acid ligase II
MNAGAIFRDAARAHPERVAFIERGTHTTFAELQERVSRVAGALQERGFVANDRALILLPMSVQLYAALLGVLQQGGTAVFLDPWVGFRTMIRLARHARLKAWLGTPKSHLLRPFVRGIDIAPLFFDRFTGAPRDAMQEMRDDDRALVTYTTGSAGNPKGVNRTHRILVAQHERLAEAFPAHAGDVDLCTFPVFALNNLALGIPTLIPPIDLRRVADADPQRVARAARHANVTTATASPPLFDRLATIDDRPRFRRILTGGAPVSDAQLRNWMRAWPDTEIVIAYGSSEAEPVAHITAEERLRAGGRGYVAGKIVHGVRARIDPLTADGAAPASGADAGRSGRRSTGTSAATLASTEAEMPPASSRAPLASSRAPARDPLPENASPDQPESRDDTPVIGELLVAGDHVCRDYDHDAHSTRQNKVFDADGTVWHRMGDTGWFDEEERFRIAGRVHSTIWRNGQAVHAQLIEQAAIGDDPRIKRVAALQVGARVAVVVESDDEQHRDEVANGVRGRLAAAGEPCDIVLVTREPLPVDPRHNSKIDYERLRGRL